MKFTKRTYKRAQARVIAQLAEMGPVEVYNGVFRKKFEHGVAIVNRGTREKGLWK